MHLRVLDARAERHLISKDALEGSPTILVCKGDIIRRALNRARITDSELRTEMRLAGINKVGDVEWAILEPNGKVSFIEHQERNPSKQRDDSDPA